MEDVTPWRTATRYRQRQTQIRGVLLGVLLLSLALAACGLLLTSLAASATSVPVLVQGEAAPPLFRPRPTRTPRPTQTATVAPSPTATPTLAPTATATGTGSVGTHPGGQAGTGAAGTQTTASPPGALLMWGLGVLVIALLGFGGFLVLLTRRTARASQPSEFAPRAPRPTLARLNQLHQLLPARHVAPPLAPGHAAEPLLEENHAWNPLAPRQKPLMWAPLNPPRWLIEAGLLKGETEEQSAGYPLEPPARFPADQSCDADGE